MRATKIIQAAVLIAVVAGSARTGYGQSDSAVILQFQRAADSYAFAQRQEERRNGPATRMIEGQFFTPIAASVFRARVHAALGSAGCTMPARGEAASEIPAVNASAATTGHLPHCVIVALPHLPEDLEYRVAGIALILADTRRNVVVDVLHATFP